MYEFPIHLYIFDLGHKDEFLIFKFRFASGHDSFGEEQTVHGNYLCHLRQDLHGGIHDLPA